MIEYKDREKVEDARHKNTRNCCIDDFAREPKLYCELKSAL